MKRELLIEDIEFLYSKLIEHPLFIINKAEREKFDQLFNQIIYGVTTYEDFILAASRLTCFFGDGHTNIELPYLRTDKVVNLPCYWRGDKLLLSTAYKGLKSDSEIISIEGVPIKHLVNLMTNKIPHENEYLVKSRMINYPYKNYHIFSELNLQSIFGEKERFDVRFMSGERYIDLVLPLEQYNGYLDYNDDNFIYYEVEEDTATLHLDACIFNDLYRNTLDALADICLQRNIKVLVLDLSKNMGGNSAVIDEFIKYIYIEEYRRYEMIDYSKGRADYITRRTDVVKNLKYTKCLNAEIHCNVSYDTFSSARTFAVTLKDNGIATKITGTPTGGKPNSFGMPKRFKTPNCSVSFRVSQCLFMRPNMDGDDEIALFPDDV